MRILITGWLGAGSTEVASMLGALRKIEVFNSAMAIKDLVAERGESFQILERETRSGEYDLDYLLRNKALEYLDEYDGIVIEGRLGLLVLGREFDVRILLTGTESDQISHVASRRGIAAEKASKVVDSSDRERRALVEKLFDHDLELSRFDPVVNTSYYGFDKSVSVIDTISRNHG